MKVIKRINNNVAICTDNNCNELIAFGKGIGYPKMPYELTDLTKIWRTYYGVNPSYMNLLDEIPSEIFEHSIKIVDYAKRKIKNEINSNIVFTLADHINFAVERYKKHMELKMPFFYDIQHLYANELQVGEFAVQMLNKQLKIFLSKDEAVSIALHFINAENIKRYKQGEADEKKLLADITSIIEQDFSIHVNQKSFNYSRFVTHMQYLLKRRESNDNIASENKKIFESMKESYEQTYLCAIHIKEYLIDILKWAPNDEELLYFMLHINRLCSREDCNR